jgi:dephospho-CoA kinase
MLADLGAEVFDADEIVRGLYAPGGAGEAAAVELFGPEVLGADGRVDRARIARMVFSDPERRHRLEARIHPLVRDERARRFAEAERRGADVVVVEASQLFEAKSEPEYDRVLLVVAPETERLRRWERKGGDVEDARRRIAGQIAPSEAFDRADDRIVNDGTLEDLRRKVEEVYRSWRA